MGDQADRKNGHKEPPRHSRRRHRADALSLSACGNSKDDAGSGSASPSEASTPATPSGGNGGGNGGKLAPAQRESLTKLRSCMIKKGYDMPEINPNNPVMAPKNTNGKSNGQVNKDAAGVRDGVAGRVTRDR